MTQTTPRPTAAAKARWPAAALGWPIPRMMWLAVLVIASIALPFVLPDASWLGIMTLGLIWMTLNQSWNLVLGFSGVWNFGQLALYAIGAYVAALLSLHAGLPPVASLILGGLVAAGAALLLSLPALRLRGIYVSLLTFGFAEVVRLLVISDQTGLTGGSYGLTGFAGFGITGLDPDTKNRLLYWIVLAVAILTALVMYAVIHSPLGNGLIALRDNPSLAAARGVDARTHQAVAFAISGFFAGLAGGLYAFVFNVVSPSLMGLGPLTLLVTMLVVGGLGTLMGPIVGTLIITVLQGRLQEWPEARLIVLGAVLLAIILLIPRGLVPVIAALRQRVERWMSDGDR